MFQALPDRSTTGGSQAHDLSILLIHWACPKQGKPEPVGVSRLLEEITLVDTPGVLSGEKQRIERTYNFIDVCGWFAARCDLILLVRRSLRWAGFHGQLHRLCSCA